MSLKNSWYKLIWCWVDSEVYHRDWNPNAIKVYWQNIRPERILRYHLYHLELSTRQYIPLESWKNPSSLIEDTFVFCWVEIRGMVVRILSLNPNAAYFWKFYWYTSTMSSYESSICSLRKVGSKRWPWVSNSRDKSTIFTHENPTNTNDRRIKRLYYWSLQCKNRFSKSWWIAKCNRNGFSSKINVDTWLDRTWKKKFLFFLLPLIWLPTEKDFIF